MVPPPLATAAAAAAEEFLEVRCAGCEETLEVERGLTEFVCPDCATAQSLPPELMPPPRRRALPLPRRTADARGARLPCGACGELLSVPVGLSRCACPLCGAELAVDSARLRNCIISSAEAAVVPLAAVSVPPIVAAREKWQERPSYAMRAGLPRAEPDERQGYTAHMIDGEHIHLPNETVANNSLQRNRPPLGRRIVGNEERQALPLNEVRDHVNDQHLSYTIQPKQMQLAHLHRVTHSEEMQDGLLSHEVYGEAGHTELIDEATATHRNQGVGCSVSPQTVSIGERHMKTPAQIIQQVHKQPFHESHAEGSQLYCLDLDGVVHPPINQAKHGEEASTEMINKTVLRESIRPTGCAVEPNSVNAEKRKASTTNQAIRERINPATNREAMCSLPIKETTASCSSKQKKSKLANAKTILEDWGRQGKTRSHDGIARSGRGDGCGGGGGGCGAVCGGGVGGLRVGGVVRGGDGGAAPVTEGRRMELLRTLQGSTEMSDVVKFVFYYGPGTVRTNGMGVDLSDFQYIEVPLTAPQTWSVSQLTDWLTKCLGLNTETYTVGVHALWTRSSSAVYLYLRPVQRDSQWVRWLQGCESRGFRPIALVLPVLKEVSAPEGEGGYDPGLSSEGIHLSMSKFMSNSVNVEKRKASTTNQTIREHISPATNRGAMCSLPIKETTASCSSKQKKSKLANAKTIGKKRHIEQLNHIIQQAEGQNSDSGSHGTQVDFERQSKANERPGNTSILKEQEQVAPPNKLADLKQKNVRTSDGIQKEQIEVNVSKQTSGWTQKKNRKVSIASSNAGLQVRRNKRLAKDSAAAIENEPVESDPGDLPDFGPSVQVPADAMDDKSIEWEPLQQCPASPDGEVSVAITDTESVEDDEQYAVPPDESTSDSDYPDTDRISAGLYPSTPSAHKLPKKISDELDDLDLTTIPSNSDMSDPEHFARNYCRLLPLEVRRALAKKKYNVFHDRLMPEGSNKVSLHDLTDSEEQQQGIKGHKAGGNLCVKMWTLPEGVRVPVSLNMSGLPIGENANMLIYFLGALARDGILAPLTCISWKNIPKENKDVMWHIVKLKFDVDPPHELSVLRSIRNKWRVWKCHLKRKHYDPHTTEEERLADRDPRVSKEQWRVLVAYWNTEKAKARSAASKASRAKSTYINKTGSKSFARMRQEESRSGDPSLESPEGSGDDYAPAIGANRRVSARRHTPGPSPKGLQERSETQAARAKRKAGDEVSTLGNKVVVTEESRPKNSQESAVSEALRAKRRAEDEADALRKKVIVMEQSQKKLQEDLARVMNTMSAMQKMMATGGSPNRNG